MGFACVVDAHFIKKVKRKSHVVSKFSQRFTCLLARLKAGAIFFIQVLAQVFSADG
ncbi:Uncharacterised protein [Vibrio cholerae]|nr:Uncharacterised protein [Vibrio cholerae]